MAWELFDYVNARSENEFKKWTLGLQKGYLGKLNSKIDLLEQHGMGLLPNMLEGPLVGYPNTYKLTCKGRVQLRPMLCRGPVKNDQEFTFLIGATERDWEYVPSNAPKEAENRRLEVLADSKNRRRAHEKVGVPRKNP
ncbi:MAG TPA: hypothetical protein VG860_21585 [Terriglobia bacterium]|jgi:hypothetical protein|nr:hypothetical protein [Terriglobia bacterium]